MRICSGCAMLLGGGWEQERQEPAWGPARCPLPLPVIINTFLSFGMHKWWRARTMVAALDLEPGTTPFRRVARRLAALSITSRRQDASCWVC